MNKRFPEKGKLAVIDDDETARLSIKQMLMLRGYKVQAFSSAETALAWPALLEMGCIISDIKMPGMDGEQFLAEIIKYKTPPPIIMITGHGDISTAVTCLKMGAYDFIEKPFDDEALLAAVARAVEKSSLQRESNELRNRVKMLSSSEDGRFGIIGDSLLMKDLYEQIQVVSQSNAPVLICGETGSGKEMVAKAIHLQSSRSRGPFVPINVGALSETTIESELFGHTRGAFTGANTERAGKLVTASRGTLLLDEIESISERTQIQLLRVLEDGLVQPLGADTTCKVDIRILVATKQNLKELVRQGHMREDFYHRIAVLMLMIPPLRDRKEDIPLLVSHFIHQAAQRNNLSIPEIPDKIFSDMMQHSWPGNVRELKNSVERMVVTSHNGALGSFIRDTNFDTTRLLSLPATSGKLREEMEKTEKYVIETALREQNGGINAASQALGISRRALYERMKKYNLYKEDFR